MNKNIYIKPIEAPYISEVLEERFDGALALMTPNSLIFGGAIRDILADKPLLGDLDIAVSKAEYQTLYNNFVGSVKWTEDVELPPIPIPKHAEPHTNSGLSYNPNKMTVSTTNRNKSSYDEMEIQEVATFKTLGDIQIQLIASSSDDSNLFEAAANVARTVDLRCCGLIMTPDGSVFEVVKDAANDCQNRVLITNSLKASDIDGLKKRIESLTKRGWTSKVNMDEALREINKQKEIEKKVARAKAKKANERRKSRAKRAKAMSTGIGEGINKFGKFISKEDNGYNTVWVAAIPRSEARRQLPPAGVLRQVASNYAENYGVSLHWEVINESASPFYRIITDNLEALVHVLGYVGFNPETRTGPRRKDAGIKLSDVSTKTKSPIRSKKATAKQRKVRSGYKGTKKEGVKEGVWNKLDVHKRSKPQENITETVSLGDDGSITTVKSKTTKAIGDGHLEF
jgi:hypothetical protein